MASTGNDSYPGLQCSNTTTVVCKLLVSFVWKQENHKNMSMLPDNKYGNTEMEILKRFQASEGIEYKSRIFLELSLCLLLMYVSLWAY